MNQTVDILCRARALYAAAPSHAPLGTDPKPGTRCVVFALHEASPHQAYMRAKRALVDAIGDPDVARWNAEHSTAEVLDAFDRAIAAQKLHVPPLRRAEQPSPVEA